MPILTVPPARSETTEEARLLDVVGRRLSPSDEERYRRLREQLDAGDISESAYASLRDIVERWEALWVERVAALYDLARLRGTTYEAVLLAPEIQSLSNAA
jgi:hypothetical protein